MKIIQDNSERTPGKLTNIENEVGRSISQV